MPETKFEDVVFSIMMVVVMVYAMICYNIAFELGGMQNKIFLIAFHEMMFMGPIGFVLDFFIAGRIAQHIAFSIVNPKEDKIILIIIAISVSTVCIMCPLMSLAATIIIKHPGLETPAVWAQKTVLNFPMALCWQLFVAGPIVRKLFALMFRRKNA